MIGGILAQGIAQRAWGQARAQLSLRGDQADADAHLSSSLRAFELGNLRLEAARTHVAWGKILRQRGEWELARAHFEQAAAQFEASGLERELDETLGLIREYA